MSKATEMNYDNFIDNLKQRGFVNKDKIGSICYCNKDEKHYLLLTDGLLIYSTIPNYANVDYLPKERTLCWDFIGNEYSKNPFYFSKLEALIGEAQP